MPTQVVTHAGQQHETYTAAASAAARTLAVSAIGVVWLFAGGLTTQDATPQVILKKVESSGSLHAALVLAVATLALDLLQYAWASVAWGVFHSRIDIVDVDDGRGELTTG